MFMFYFDLPLFFSKIIITQETKKHQISTHAHLRGLVGAEIVPVRGLRPGLSCPRAWRWLRYLVCDRRSCWDRVNARQAGAWPEVPWLEGAWLKAT